mmetsp:Transcript_62241/g.148526  ORF Transcript_62241/g.148526 Transcript_62241/m.148526 type:complete len:271 (+) Transcript_62241:101-913(+)
MSGNPFGLTQIQHYGQMQRVGGKAAGFINKKFFHPSSLRNQEKLWKAQTAADTEARKQDQMEKLREEELKVEELRKQMYLSGQAKPTDMIGASIAASQGASSSSSVPKGWKSEQQAALDEQRRRREKLKESRLAGQEAAAGGENPEGEDPPPAEDNSKQDDRVLAPSMYKEDVWPNGHGSVWGSFFNLEEQTWGYSCCKLQDQKVRCPHAPEEEAAKEPVQKVPREGPRKRRRKGSGQQQQQEQPQSETAEAVGAGAAPAKPLAEGESAG